MGNILFMPRAQAAFLVAIACSTALSPVSALLRGSTTGDAALDAIAAKYGGTSGLESILDMQASNGAGSCPVGGTVNTIITPARPSQLAGGGLGQE